MGRTDRNSADRESDRNSSRNDSQTDGDTDAVSASVDGDDGFEPVELVSKSEMKRHMQSLQTLGERLATTPEIWPELELPDRLVKALRDASTITAHEARRRHLQFIGKLMKTVDDEAIKAALLQRDSSSDHHKNIHHEAERWRERWLKRGLDEQARNELLTEFVDQYPDVEVQALRQTLRNALKDIALNRNRGNTRKLYQIARDGIAGEHSS